MGFSVEADQELLVSLQVLVAVGDAQLDACALVGDAAVEHEQEHVAG